MTGQKKINIALAIKGFLRSRLLDIYLAPVVSLTFTVAK